MKTKFFKSRFFLTIITGSFFYVYYKCTSFELTVILCLALIVAEQLYLSYKNEL